MQANKRQLLVAASGPPFRVLPSRSGTVGAPSFAQSAKGGKQERIRNGVCGKDQSHIGIIARKDRDRIGGQGRGLHTLAFTTLCGLALSYAIFYGKPYRHIANKGNQSLAFNVTLLDHVLTAAAKPVFFSFPWCALSSRPILRSRLLGSANFNPKLLLSSF
jgi:hypothetical protein